MNAWSREDIIIAYALYCVTPLGKINPSNKVIQQVAKIIPHSVASIVMRMRNFRYIDPKVSSGLKNVAKADRMIYEEFKHDWGSLSLEAETLTGLAIFDSSPLQGAKPLSSLTNHGRVSRERHFFKQAVLAAYDDRCFISGCALPQMLVASHIKPYSQCRSEADRVSPDNGICLNTFYDKAFDRGLITITPSMKIYVSPIILDSPQDTFNPAQAEMERRRTRKAPKSPKAEYLLAGRLFCGHCKGPMQGVSGTGKSGNKWYYYYCGNTRGKNKTCDKKQVSRDRLERAVVDFTVRYILQEEVLEELARKVHAAQERQNNTASEIAFYEKKLADNKKSIANVLRAIESGAATQTLPARLQELENEQAVILGELSFLKGKRLAFTEDQILFALMKHLEPYPDESEQDYRRRIISDFVSEVYIYDDRLLIYFNISSEDGKLKSADLSNIEGGEFDEGLVSSTNLIAGRTPEVTIVVLPYGFVLATQIKDRL